jgi:L-fucose mutarotase/ribose pyranase (RbsD/FucU family)
VLHDFNVSMGYGAYCLFTDASMVGQPTKKDEFKVIAIGMIRFNDDVSAAVSLLTDDAAGPDFAAMLKAVSGATVGPAK